MAAARVSICNALWPNRLAEIEMPLYSAVHCIRISGFFIASLRSRRRRGKEKKWQLLSAVSCLFLEQQQILFRVQEKVKEGGGGGGGGGGMSHEIHIFRRRRRGNGICREKIECRFITAASSGKRVQMAAHNTHTQQHLVAAAVAAAAAAAANSNGGGGVGKRSSCCLDAGLARVSPTNSSYYHYNYVHTVLQNPKMSRTEPADFKHDFLLCFALQLATYHLTADTNSAAATAVRQRTQFPFTSSTPLREEDDM